MTLLDRCSRLAVRLAPCSAWLGFGALAGAAASIAVLFAAPAALQERWLVPLMLLFLWCLCGWGVLHALAAVPDRPGAAAGRWQRLGTALRRGGFSLLLLGFLLTTLALLVLSLRLLLL